MLILDDGNRNFSYAFEDNGNSIMTINLKFTSYIPPKTILKLVTNISAVVQDNIVYSLMTKSFEIGLNEFITYTEIENNTIQAGGSIGSISAIILQATNLFHTIKGKATYKSALDLQIFGSKRFIQINYPPNLNSLYANTEPAPANLGLIPNIIQMAIGDIIDSTTISPGKFSEYGISPYFLISFGKEIVLLLFIALIICLVTVLEKKIIKIKNPMIKNLCSKICNFFKYNFFLLFCLSNYMSLIQSLVLQFFTSLESENSTRFKTVNNLFALAFAIFGIMVIIFILYHIISYIEVIQKNSDARYPEQTKILFNDTKKTDLIHSFFSMIVVGRVIIHVLIIILARNSPITVIILITILNSLMLYFLIIKRPFIDKISIIREVGSEIIIFIGYLFDFLFIYLENGQENEDLATRMTFGWVMIIITMVMFMWSAGFYICEQIKKIWIGVAPLIRKYRSNSKIAQIVPMPCPSEINLTSTSRIPFKRNTPLQIELYSAITDFGSQSQSHSHSEIHSQIQSQENINERLDFTSDIKSKWKIINF